MSSESPAAVTGPRCSSCATSPRRSARCSRCGPARWSSTRGSIHALVGENGAGKSTLVKIVAGVHQRDAGRLPFRGEDVDFASTAGRQGRRHRGDLPGAHALPRPVGDREHLHGPPAARPRRPDRPGRDVRRGRVALRPARRPHRPAPPRPRASRSPTSRSSRSPRPSRSTPASWSWTSRPPPSAGSRSSGSSRWPAACATRAGRWSSSPTASTRSSPSATPSP